MPTIVNGDCEWDADKADRNVTKHGVTFDEAMTVFADPRAVYLDDGSGSGRILAIGLSCQGRLLAVVHVQREERDRLISARLATRTEAKLHTKTES